MTRGDGRPGPAGAQVPPGSPVRAERRRPVRTARTALPWFSERHIRGPEGQKACARSVLHCFRADRPVQRRPGFRVGKPARPFLAVLA